VSLPTLITGTAITKVRRTAANELALRFSDGGTERPWSGEPNLFSRARSLGLDAALIGWYHPYCRVIGRDVTRCRWYPYVPNPAETLRDGLLMQAVLLLDTVPGVFRFGVLERLGGGWMRGSEDPQWHATQYRRIHQDTVEAAADAGLELVFAHYPIPHLPFIFDRDTGSMRFDGQSTYADNLALTDRTLAELRLALERAGLWDRTALIVTSDHWHRRAGEARGIMPVVGRPEYRVPLVVRLHSQRQPVARSERLHTAAAHDLALAILSGKLETPAQLDAVMANLPRWMRLD
jgi:hypothetical protein